MREFKPMVKMETTEPTVELKLKKGGAVKKMADGGMPMGAMIGAPKGGMMAGAKPKKPSLASRRRAMMASGAAGAPAGRAESMMSAMPAMKKGGRAKGGEMESPKVHKAEMKELSGIKKELTKHEGMPASKGHRGLKTGGVVNGQGGFKTGGVAMANAGGFRKGGAAKKFAEGGRVQHDGGPEQMKQGKKKPAGPVSINQLSGTYKKGGAVMMAFGGSAVKPPISVSKPNPAVNASQQRSDQIKASYAAAAKASEARNDAIRASYAAAAKTSQQRSIAVSQSLAAAISQSRAAATVKQSQPIPITPAQARSMQAKYGGYWNDTLKYQVVGGPTPIPPQLRVTVSASMPRPVPSAMPQVTPMPKPVVTPMVSEMPQSGYGGGDGGGGDGGGGGGMRRGGKVQYNGKKRGGAVC
jgi:hypothetical protein